MKNLLLFCLLLVTVRGNSQDITNEPPHIILSADESTLYEHFRVKKVMLSEELNELHEFLHEELAIFDLEYLTRKKGKININIETYQYGERTDSRCVLNSGTVIGENEKIRLYIKVNTIDASIEDKMIAIRAQTNGKTVATKNESTTFTSKWKSTIEHSVIVPKRLVGCKRSLENERLIKISDKKFILWTYAKAEESASCDIGWVDNANIDEIDDALILRAVLYFND